MIHALISDSLERVAERHGDPAEAVYARLFAQQPEMEALFVGDKDGLSRGNMLANVFEVMLDLAGPRTYGHNMVRAEITNHDQLGVPGAVFLSFFPVVVETLKELSGEDWTPEVDRAWTTVLDELAGLVPA
jgi:hemoglobin-like flavoprotein